MSRAAARRGIGQEDRGKGKMRALLLGGGGLRVPHLVHGLLAETGDLALEELDLYDIDRRRADTMAALCAELARREERALRLTVLDRPRPPAPVDFVLTAIRPGGDHGRARDEALCRASGLLGQETTGAAGFLMALRTAPALVQGVTEALASNPSAYVLNFTNPAGLMTEVLSRAGVKRAVGLCDTPSHFLVELADALGIEEPALRPQYFGLNHLGFFTGIGDQDGRDLLPQVLADLERLRERVRPLGYFPAEVVRAIGNLPTEYVHFYLDRRGSLARQERTPESRGAQIERLNRRFWEAVAQEPAAKPEGVLDTYLSVMAERSATYLRAETGSTYVRPVDGHTYLEQPGYEAIAIRAMRALTGGPPATLMLNVAAGGESIGVQSAEVYETTVRVDAQGLRAQPVTPPGPVAMSLLAQVKTYERLTLEAIAHPAADRLLAALLAHPLVADGPVAMAFLDRAAEAGVEGVQGVWH